MAQSQTATAAAAISAGELVRSLFEAFGRGDIPYIIQHIALDCRWVGPGAGSLPIGGEFFGPDGVARFFKILAETEQITSFEPKEFFEKDDSVVVLGTEAIRAVNTGKSARTNWAMEFRVREGQVHFWEQYFDTAAYAKAHQEGL